MSWDSSKDSFGDEEQLTSPASHRLTVCCAEMAEPHSHPPAVTLERTSSLPQLESVPSPPRSLPPTALTPSTTTLSSSPSAQPPPVSANASAASTPTPPDSSSSVPTLHNELPRSFSGSILQSLEHLGVSAYSTADVEQTVIARALQVEAEAQQSRHPPSSRRPPSSPKRKRIPKKIGTSIASASSALPIPLPIVHHDDPVTAAGSMAKKRLEDALAIRPPRDRTPPVRRARPTTEEEGEGERRRVDDVEAPSVRSERQRLIDTGEVTPFNGMLGVEKGYRRVSRPEHLQSVPPSTAQRGERKERGERKDSRPSSVAAPSSRSKARVRSATPTLKPPRAKSSRATLSATPPPDSSRSTSASSVRSEQSPSPAVSVSELPARLTRARVKEEVKSIEMAFKKQDREKHGVKQEEIDMAEDDNEGVHMMEEEEDEEEKGDSDVKEEKESDEEWKGDEESSEEEVVAVSDASDEDHRPRRPSRRQRPLPARRRLMKPDDVETDEAETAEGDEVGVLDDDDDDGDEDEASEGGGGGVRTRAGRFIDDFFDLDYEERIHAMRHSKVFANEVRRVEGREEAKEGEEADGSLDVAFDGGFVLPGRIWDRLFGYQKTSIKWMWELHR